MEKENNEHKCKEENIKSIKMISEDTKRCPNCTIPIHKIEGCSQFFCTSCNTKFDWNTMKKIGEDELYHNPYYSEILEEENKIIFNRDELEELEKNNKDSKVVYKIKILNKLYDNIKYNLVLKYKKVNNDNEKLRLDFLKNKMDEKQYKINLYKYNKSNGKRKDFYNLFVDTKYKVKEILIKCKLEFNNINNININELNKEIEQLKTETNNQLNIIKYRYNNKSYIINEYLDIIIH